MNILTVYDCLVKKRAGFFECHNNRSEYVSVLCMNTVGICIHKDSAALRMWPCHVM